MSLSPHFLLVTIFFQYGNCRYTPNPSITINQGTLQGSIAKDYYGALYYVFKSIPYAKPPIGNLRFKSPQPAEPWFGVLNATVSANMCAQQKWNWTTYQGSEDCLYLEVYTKSISDNEYNRKPVMVWIHGGAFLFGSSRDYSPDFLMTQDIVLVLIQYRLNIFGFLSIDDVRAGVPGNAGFKDQVLALKWIRRNIHNFGGDPHQVTIFGQNAGAASVHLLVMSKLAKGLFHKAIAQSGVGDILTSSNTLYKSLANILGCNNSDIKVVVNCFQRCDVQKLISARRQAAAQNPNLRLQSSGLSIEPSSVPDAFITQKLNRIIKSGHFNQVPFLTGYVAHEGALALFIPFPVRPNVTNYELFVPAKFHIPRGSQKSIELGNKIKQFYYGHKAPSYQHLDEFVNYHTDSLFLYPMYRFVKKQVKVSKAPIYYYHFNYHTTLNQRWGLRNYSQKFVAHTDDTRYLFVSNTQKLAETSNEYIGAYRMVKLWTNFAKSASGNPNSVNFDPQLDVKWKPVQSNRFNYLDIGEKLVGKIDPVRKRMEFWESVDPEFNRNIMSGGASLTDGTIQLEWLLSFLIVLLK